MNSRRFNVSDTVWSLQVSFVAVLSFYIALLFNLEFAPSAAIIGMLAAITLKPKREVFVIIIRWYVSVGLVTLITLIFEVVGYSLTYFFILLALFVLISLYFRLTDCMVISTVIMTHYFTDQTMNFSVIGNEFSLLTIGILIAVSTKAVAEFIHKRVVDE